MAYARYESGKSDIYLFRNLKWEMECVACRLRPDGAGWFHTAYFEYSELNKVLEHVLEHKNAGHKVPKNTIARIKTELKDR